MFPEIENKFLVLRDILLPESEIDLKYTISDHLWNYLQEYKKKHQAKGNGFGYGMVTHDTENSVSAILQRWFRNSPESRDRFQS